MSEQINKAVITTSKFIYIPLFTEEGTARE